MSNIGDVAAAEFARKISDIQTRNALQMRVMDELYAQEVARDPQLFKLTFMVDIYPAKYARMFEDYWNGIGARPQYYNLGTVEKLPTELVLELLGGRT